jgi:hypothetical protein
LTKLEYSRGKVTHHERLISVEFAARASADRAALLAALSWLLPRLARLLSATALLTTLTALLTWLVVRIHNYCVSCLRSTTV